MDAILGLSAHVVETRYRDLPPEALQAAKIFILDTIGVGVAGTAGPWVEELVDAVRGWGAGDQSRVFVRGTRLSAPAAAMVNAYQIHNSEFDCVHEGAVVHPMATVLASALASAERQGGIDGRALLTAVALGVDTACHIGAASRAPLRFFRPGTAGGFGAAAAVGKLMGFDRQTLVNAMGLVYGQLGGTMQAHVEGSPLLGMQMGFNARNALIACDMAARGLPAPQHVLEGPFGYFRLFEGEYDPTRLLPNLGKVWRIAELSHKPFPSGRATHRIVDGLLELRGRHGLAGEAVERVRVDVPPLADRLVGRPIVDRLEPNYARLCGVYVGARALRRGTVGLDDFTPPALADRETHALARRFEIVADNNPDPNALGPVTVAVTLTDGRCHSATVDRVYGSPAKPMSPDAHLQKFRRNWLSGAAPLPEPAGERLIRLVDELEAVPDARALIALTSPGGV